MTVPEPDPLAPLVMVTNPPEGADAVYAQPGGPETCTLPVEAAGPTEAELADKVKGQAGAEPPVVKVIWVVIVYATSERAVANPALGLSIAAKNSSCNTYWVRPSSWLAGIVADVKRFPLPTSNFRLKSDALKIAKEVEVLVTPAGGVQEFHVSVNGAFGFIPCSEATALLARKGIGGYASDAGVLTVADTLPNVPPLIRKV